ncbi:MAG: hypothetical protein HYX27_17545 [Acidobacteria bacterium]|nr:hypothetical protein [Acidobacteriota bacterium]
MRIGFIRIPNFAPADFNGAILQFEREIVFMQASTGGLVIDDMRNPGGSVGYTNVLMSYLMHKGFRAMGFEVRATSNWVVSISSALESAKAQRAPQSIIDLLSALKDNIVQAADSVPAVFQDAGRGLLVGFRINSAGGNNTNFAAGAFSEGVAGMTLALQLRLNPVATPEYPASTYIENVGVRPDVEIDYMKRDNLLQRGKPFVDAVTARMVDYLKNGK